MDRIRTDAISTKKRKRLLAGLLISLAAASVAVAVSKLSNTALQVDRDLLVIDTVRRGEFVHIVRAPGVLAPRDVRQLVAQSAGRVQEIVLRPGAVVTPDAIIVRLVNPQVETDVHEAELALVQGQAQLAALRLSLQSQVLDQKARVAEVQATHRSAALQSEAEAEAAREHAVSALQARRSQILAEQLAQRVAVEEERLQTLRSATQAQLRAESARIAQLQATFERQRNLLAALEVRASMHGVLQSLPLQVGQQVAAGAQVARVAAPDNLLAELRVPEFDARDLRVGLKASVDLRNGHLVEGTIARVDPGVDNGAVRIDIHFAVPLPSGARPDLSVEGMIEIARIPDTLFINRLVNGQPDSKLTVFKLDSNGHDAARVPVTVGKASARELQIVTGLNAGDRIIVSDTSTWSDRNVLRID